MILYHRDDTPTGIALTGNEPVGRESEKDKIRMAIHDSANGMGRCIVLSGPAGIGKTTLVESACEMASGQDFGIIRGAALQESDRPFLAFSRALDALTDIPIFEEQEYVSFSQLFAINNGGMLIAKASNEEEELDADIFAGMLTAVQSFVRDSFDSSGSGSAGLGRLEYGAMKILIEHGEEMFLVAVLREREHADMARSMKAYVRELLSRHGDMVRQWNGSASQARPIVESLAGLLRTKFLVRKDLEGVKIEAERIRISENALSILNTRAESAPVLLVLEDMHWADGNSLFVLGHLVRNMCGSRILILATCRPGESRALDSLISGMGAEPAFSELTLGSLDLRDTREIIDRLYDPNVIPQEFVSRLADRCRGNPLFMKELLIQMAKEGAIARKGEQYILEREDYEIPKSVEDVIDRKLVNLEPDAMAMIEFASCFGMEFPVDMLQNVSTVPDAAAALRKLQSAGILSRCNGSAEFSHALFQNVVYNNMSERWKSLNHLQIGRLYEDTFKERLDSVLFELARHFARTKERQKALDYSVRAAEKAESSYAVEQSIALYEQALGILEDMGEAPGRSRKAEILERLGDMQVLAEKLDAALESYGKAYEIADSKQDRSRLRRKRSRAFENKSEFDAAISEAEMGESEAEPDSAERWQALLQRAGIYSKKGLNRESLDAASGASDRLEALGAGPKVLEEAHWIIGIDHWHLGNYEEAQSIFTAALDSALDRKDSRGIARGYHNLALINMDMGRLDKALECQQKTIEIDILQKNIRGIAGGYGNLGVIHQRKGDYRKGYEWTLKCEAEFKKIGDRYGLARTYLNIGVMLMEMGDFTPSLEFFAKGRDMFAALGDSNGTAMGIYFTGLAMNEMGDLVNARKSAEESLHINLGIGEKQRILASRLLISSIMNEDGEYSEAEKIGREDLATAEEMKDMEAMIAISQVLANSAMGLGNSEEAARLAERSLELSRQSDMKFFEATGLSILAKLKISQGRPDEAMPLFEESAGIFEGLGAKTQQAKVRFDWGIALRQAGSDDGGLVGKALEVFEASGMKEMAEKARHAQKEKP